MVQNKLLDHNTGVSSVKVREAVRSGPAVEDFERKLRESKPKSGVIYAGATGAVIVGSVRDRVVIHLNDGVTSEVVFSSFL